MFNRILWNVQAGGRDPVAKFHGVMDLVDNPFSLSKRSLDNVFTFPAIVQLPWHDR